MSRPAPHPPTAHRASLAALTTLLLAGPPGPPEADTTPPHHGWRDRQTWPLEAAAGLDALGFWPAATHPVVNLGVSMIHLERGRFSLRQPLRLGYLAHRDFAHGPSFDTGLDLRWRARIGLTLGGGLGFGVQHMRTWAQAYRADASGYHPARVGRTSARVLPFVEFGYDFAARTRAPVAVFARYQQVLLAPFAPGNELPVMGRAQILVGLSVPLRRPTPTP